MCLLIKSFFFLFAKAVFFHRKFGKAFLAFITYRAKLLNPDWLRQRAFFLNHEGTFGNQEGMIT